MYLCGPDGNKHTMRKTLYTLALPAMMFLAFSSMKTDSPEDPPEKKKNAEIRVITLRDGAEEITDTLTSGEEPGEFLLQGNKRFKWVTREEESQTGAFSERVGFEGDGNEKIIVLRQAAGKGPLIIREFEAEGDSGEKVVVRVDKFKPGRGLGPSVTEWVTFGDSVKSVERVVESRIADEEGYRFYRERKGYPVRMTTLRREAGNRTMPGRWLEAPARSRERNLINLADPGILSYKKKKLSDGREKITIIRKERTGEVKTAYGFPAVTSSDTLAPRMNPRVFSTREIRMERPQGTDGKKGKTEAQQP